MTKGKRRRMGRIGGQNEDRRFKRCKKMNTEKVKEMDGEIQGIRKEG